MALGYLISPVIQVEDVNGKPLVGGRIRVYRHGTQIPYITYKNWMGDHNPAEVILDAKGMCILIAEDDGLYDIYCEDRNHVEQWSRLNVGVGGGGGSGGGTPGEMQHWLGKDGPVYTPFPGDEQRHPLGISTSEVEYVGDFIDHFATCQYPDHTDPYGYIYLKPGLYYVSCIIRYQQADDALSNTLDEVLIYTGPGNANESLAYQMDSSGPEATGNRHNVRVQFIRKVTDDSETEVLYFAPGTPVDWKEAYIQKLEIVKLDSVAISPTIVQGLETVAHDDTMTGDGTVLNPLSIQSALDDKQDTLVPGEGIALDSDGVISATDMSNIFWCVYGTTTYAEMLEAYNEGKHLFLIKDKLIAPLSKFSNDGFDFYYVTGVGAWGGPTFNRTSISPSGTWGDLPTTAQSDWNVTDNYAAGFIRNKPDLSNYQKNLTPGEGIALDSDGNISVDTDDLPSEPVELSPLVAGENITIQDSDGVTVISAIGGGGGSYSAGYGIDIDSDNVISVDSDVLPSYTPGEGIDIDSDGVISVDSDEIPSEPVELTPLVAGHGITIEESDGETVISATGEAYSSGYGIIIDSDNVISVDSDELPTYTPGEGIDIDSDGVISVDSETLPSEPVELTPLVAGRNITIEESNGETVISADVPVYTAGENIVIDSDGVISAPDLQKELTPGEGIDLDSDGNISVDTDDIPSEPVELTTLVAGRNITIEDSDGNTVISAADAQTYMAGEGIDIDSDGVISATELDNIFWGIEGVTTFDEMKAASEAGKRIVLNASNGSVVGLTAHTSIGGNTERFFFCYVEQVWRNGGPVLAYTYLCKRDGWRNSSSEIQADWNQTNSYYASYIKNKPNLDDYQKALTADYGIDLDSDGNIGVDPSIIPEVPPIIPIAAGENITIEDSDGLVVISAADSPTYSAGEGINISSDGTVSIDPTEVQEKLTAGQNITIDSDGVISTTGLQKELTAGQNITIDSDGVISATGGGGGEPCLWEVDSDTGLIMPKDDKHFEGIGAPTYSQVWSYYFAMKRLVKSTDDGFEIDLLRSSHTGDDTEFGPYARTAFIKSDMDSNPYNGSDRAGLVLNSGKSGTGSHPASRVDIYAGSNGGYSFADYVAQTYVQSIVGNNYVRMLSDDIIRHSGSTDSHTPFITAQQSDTTKQYALQPTSISGNYTLVESVTKSYVDTLVGDIETLLGGI